MRITDDLPFLKSSLVYDRFSPLRFSRRVRQRPMLPAPQWPIQRIGTGPKRTICAAPVRSGGQNTRSRHARSPESKCMSNFWMALFAAQTAAAEAKPADRRHRVLSVLGGIALTLLIGGALIIAGALTH
jgi:hypothetical protein